MPFTAAQIGMDHIALDRAGPHDRDFDDEIVEALRRHARQHRHLRAAFDLKDADRIRLADHLVSRGILCGDGREVEIDAFGRLRRRSKARRMQPSMPSPSTSTFMNLSASISSLSHSMTCRFSMAAGSIGTISSSRSEREDEAARMLREMPRRAHQLAGQLERQPQPAVSEIEIELLEFGFGHAVLAPAPYDAGEAPVTSSGTPSALPTSRTAPRAR